MEKKTMDIICGMCLHRETRTDVLFAEVYFPNRYVMLKSSDKSCDKFVCPKCGCEDNIIEFGKNYISTLTRPALYNHPDKVENNRLWRILNPKPIPKTNK